MATSRKSILMHGWYSARAARKVGFYVCKHPDPSQPDRVVTATLEGPERYKDWGDEVYGGMVGELVRDVEPDPKILEWVFQVEMDVRRQCERSLREECAGIAEAARPHPGTNCSCGECLGASSAAEAIRRSAP